MDGSGGSRCLVAGVNSPRARLFWPGGQERLQLQRVKTGARQRIVTSAVSAALLLAAGFAAFVPFIPANGYYAPSAPGVGNRVNAAAAIFFASAAALVAGRLVELGAERRRVAAPLLAAAGAGLASVGAARFGSTIREPAAGQEAAVLVMLVALGVVVLGVAVAGPLGGAAGDRPLEGAPPVGRPRGRRRR